VDVAIMWVGLAVAAVGGGTVFMTRLTRARPGWYPEPGGVQRYWDGHDWVLDAQPPDSD